jgi:mRNA interferase YafQ
MMIFIWNTSFKEAYKRAIRNEMDRQIIIDTLLLASENPFDLRLKTYKIHGNSKNTYNCYLDYDQRIIFTFEYKNRDLIIYLIDIGNHDDIY